MKRFMGHKRTWWIIRTAFLLICWIGVSLLIDNEVILPSPWQVGRAFAALLKKTDTYVVLGTTLLRLLLALVISFVLALISAALSILKKEIAYFIRPIIVTLKTLPVAALIILLLVMVGHEKSPIVICGFVVFPLFYEVMYQGMKKIDRSLLDEIKTISSLNWQIIYHIHIPLAIPYLITGLLQGIGLGLKVMVMAELLAQPRQSIGKMLLLEKQYLHIDVVFAWAILLIIVVGLVEIMINRWQKKVLLW